MPQPLSYVRIDLAGLGELLREWKSKDAWLIALHRENIGNVLQPCRLTLQTMQKLHDELYEPTGTSTSYHVVADSNDDNDATPKQIVELVVRCLTTNPKLNEYLILNVWMIVYLLGVPGTSQVELLVVERKVPYILYR